MGKRKKHQVYLEFSATMEQVSYSNSRNSMGALRSRCDKRRGGGGASGGHRESRKHPLKKNEKKVVLSQKSRFESPTGVKGAKFAYKSRADETTRIKVPAGP